MACKRANASQFITSHLPTPTPFRNSVSIPGHKTILVDQLHNWWTLQTVMSLQVYVD